MTVHGKTTVKSFFERGDTPTCAQFADLIDSYQNRASGLDVFVSASTPGFLRFNASAPDYALSAIASISAADIDINGMATTQVPSQLSQHSDFAVVYSDNSSQNERTRISDFLRHTSPAAFSGAKSLGATDGFTFLRYTGSGGDTVTMPDPTASLVDNGWYVDIENAGSGDLTISQNASETINGSTSITLKANDVVRVLWISGDNWAAFYRSRITIPIGVSAATTAQAAAAAKSSAVFMDPGAVKDNPFAVRAYVHFTSAPAIVQSQRVSSVSKNGTGSFTIKWAPALPTADYVLGGAPSAPTNDIQASNITLNVAGTAAGKTVSAATVIMQNDASTPEDPFDGASVIALCSGI